MFEIMSFYLVYNYFYLYIKNQFIIFYILYEQNCRDPQYKQFTHFYINIIKAGLLLYNTLLIKVNKYLSNILFVMVVFGLCAC